MDALITKQGSVCHVWSNLLSLYHNMQNDVKAERATSIDMKISSVGSASKPRHTTYLTDRGHSVSTAKNIVVMIAAADEFMEEAQPSFILVHWVPRSHHGAIWWNSGSWTTSSRNDGFDSYIFLWTEINHATVFTYIRKLWDSFDVGKRSKRNI